MLLFPLITSYIMGRMMSLTSKGGGYLHANPGEEKITVKIDIL